MSYVIVVDTLCEGWQAWGESDGGMPEIFATKAEAQKEIDESFADLVCNQIHSGMRPDEEPEEMVMLLHEYVKGRKAVYEGASHERVRG